jgi:uncharacterized protein YacL
VRLVDLIIKIYNLKLIKTWINSTTKWNKNHCQTQQPFLYGIIGLILGIVALVLANKDKKLYTEFPGVYTEASFKNMNAGRICAVIGLILSALYVLFYIVLIAVFGISTLGNPQELMDRINDLKK